MKPLTIEELKALQVGDWVYIINKEYNFEIYRRKSTKDNDNYFIDCSYCKELDYSYSDYGRTWIAYKNKEQAEEYFLKKSEEENGLYTIYQRIESYEVCYTCVSRYDAEQHLAELKGETV